jgi:uncharacterized lipoprotein YddW (UPF0748 family)
VALAGAALIAAGMLFSCTSKAPKSLVTPPNAAAVKAGQAHREPVRGVWLTTVSRLDWPPVGSIIASTPVISSERMHAGESHHAAEAGADR